MRVAVFDTHGFERQVLQNLNKIYGHELVFFDLRLNLETVRLGYGFPAVCGFVNDHFNRKILEELALNGTKIVALRSAGYNQVDLEAAAEFGIKIVRVPAYSPHAVAEHAVTLILALNRKIIKASARVHELNFSLDGLVGFDLVGKTVGIVGLGKIGSVFAKIMLGFGCRVLACDENQKANLPGVNFVRLEQLLAEADIVSLHLPLTTKTRHMINRDSLAKMKTGAMLINTSRGALIETSDLIAALKTGKIGSAGLDVYEEEEALYFQDHSEQVLQDDVLARLMTFNNVLITAHQAFLTKEAIHNIAETSLQNLTDFAKGVELKNEVKVHLPAPKP